MADNSFDMKNKRTFFSLKKILGSAVALLTVTFCISFAPADPAGMTFDEIENYVYKIDLLKTKKQLTVYNHTDTIQWGSITGYWHKDNLVLIDMQLNTELETTAYYIGDKVCRVISKKHLTNWDAYERDHGAEAFDASKLTYTDEYRDYTFGKTLVTRELKDQKIVIQETVPAAEVGVADVLREAAANMRTFMEDVSSK